MNLKSINPMVGAIIGVTGVLATALTSAWCAIRTKEALEKAGPVEKKEKAAILLKGYLPAGACAAATSAVMIAFGTTNAKQATALAGTYAVLNRSYIKHKAEIKDLCRPLLDKDERDKLVKKYFEKNEKEEESAVDDGKQLFYEEHHDGFFRANLEDVIYADYHLNRILATQGYATVNDFYEALCMDRVEDGENLGWMHWLAAEDRDPDEGVNWIDVIHEEFDLEDGMKATRLVFDARPRAYDMVPF